MADFYLPLGVTGKTIMARLFNGGAQVGADIALSERAASGSYYGNIITAVPAGTYLVEFYDASSLVGSGQIDWDGSKEITMLSLPTVAQIVTGIFSAIIENGKTFAQIIRINFAVLKGRTTGAGTLANTFLSDDGTKARVSSAFDASKNRINVTTDGD